MRQIAIIGALVLAMATARAAQGQGKADSPSEVLGQRTQDFARCVNARGLVHLTLRLDLDRASKVEKVAIESDTALTRGSRRCIEKVALGLAFAPELAGMTIEHALQVVSGNRHGKR